MLSDLVKTPTDSKSLKKLLVETFKPTKFSVRRHGSSLAYYVDWTDGPSEEQVKAITDPCKMGSFNGMEDMYEYNGNRAAFAKFLFLHRDITDEGMKTLCAVGNLCLEDVKVCLRMDYGEMIHLGSDMVDYNRREYFRLVRTQNL
jgi:hypothetical protein